MIIAAVDDAQQQVLVQAYSFTHRRIADALVRAHRRGVEVAVVVDAEQARGEPRCCANSRAAASPCATTTARRRPQQNHGDRRGREHCAVITGSYNFTYAAQQRNAENALLLRGNPALCAAYHDNWRRHFSHASTRG